MVLQGCGEPHSGGPSDATPGEESYDDAGLLDGCADAADALTEAAYTQGPYLCCAKGEGQSCCPCRCTSKAASTMSAANASAAAGGSSKILGVLASWRLTLSRRPRLHRCCVPSSPAQDENQTLRGAHPRVSRGTGESRTKDSTTRDQLHER